MNNLIHPLILRRRSIFSFSGKEVEQEKLAALFEAAGKAPSSFNAQPWAFIYSTQSKPENYTIMAGLLNEGNMKWALAAPVLVLSLAEVYNEERNTPNTYAFHDLGMATGNFLLQATQMGLFVHPMGGYDKERAKTVLRIPSRFEPAALMALGYPSPDDNLPEDLKKRLNSAGKRKKPDKFVREGSW